ncbi:hypothetical protein BBJ28_00018037 [Nothophytophthora sp. Chile5]|nr:hypothetical protein BBJ28_00018037 [Nothophytophthora sp. Chile5]
MRLQPAVFGVESSSEASPLDAQKLMTLLSGQEAVACRRGVFYGWNSSEGLAFTAAGWELSKKNALDHRSLEILLKRNLADAGVCEGRQRKTLVLATGEVSVSVLKTLEAYFQANWRVQLYCLRRSGTKTVDRLRAEHPSSFQGVYLDRFMKELLREKPEDGVASTLEPSNQDEEVQRMASADGNDRFVFMDLDNIAGTLFKSSTLYQKVFGASSARDVRLNFRALTERTCGSDPAKVKRQVVRYAKTNPHLAQGLLALRWVLKKQSTSNAVPPHLGLLTQLIATNPDGTHKTLVLVMGDGHLDAVGKGLLAVLVAMQWRIEVHAWLDSLNDVFLGLQGEYPTSVVVKPLDQDLSELVYLKQADVAAPKAVKSSEIVSTTVSTPAAAPIGLTAVPELGMGLELSRLQKQMREMQQAFAALQTSSASWKATQQSGEVERRMQLQQDEFARRLHEQEKAFDADRYQLTQKARDARLKHRLVLQEREEMLTCPITQCLYETPVVTVCCGKTFSKAALDGLQGRDRSCPWCRQQRGFTTHLNRDMAILVQQYKAECDAFEEEA